MSTRPRCRCAGRPSGACWASSCSTASRAPCRPRWCSSSCRTGCRRRPRWSRLFSAATSSAPQPRSRCGCASRRASGWRAPGSSAWGCRWPCSRGPRHSVPAMPCPSSPCACSRASRWAPTSCCPVPCWPARSPKPPTSRAPARTSAGGTSPPSSTWPWPPGWRCRCSAPPATCPARAMPRACARSAGRTRCCPACSSFSPPAPCGRW